MYTDPLHVAYIRTNQWMHAVELQADRVIGPVSHPEVVSMSTYRNEWNQKQRDTDYFLIALNRMRVCVTSVNRFLRNKEIKQALRAFNNTVPDLEALRDIEEHVDDYDWGNGRLEKQLTDEAASYFYGPTDGAISYRGKRLEIMEARAAARKLHNVVMHELAKAGRSIDLSEWPLVKYEGQSEPAC